MIHVVVALIFQDGLVCVGKRKKAPFKDFLECPGGKVESGESLKEALSRELLEEGDAHVDQAWYLVHYDVVNEHGHFRLHWFKVHLIDSFKPIIYDEVLWVKPEDLPTLDWIEHNKPFLPLIINSIHLPMYTPILALNSTSQNSALMNALDHHLKDASCFKENIQLSMQGFTLEELDVELKQWIHFYSIQLVP